MRELKERWIKAKAAEASAAKERRETEDQLTSILNLPAQFEGSKTFNQDDLKMIVIGRMTRKIDSDQLQVIAAEHGISQYLSTLFSWTPKLKMTAWKEAAESITGPLMGAITTKPGRISYTITKEETDNE